jgi:predicted nucleic acid-binding protein
MANSIIAKSLVFDAGPIISLTTNNLLWLIEPLKQKFNGHFYMTEGVRVELVDKPLATKKFKFEALQVEQQIEAGIIEVARDPAAKSLATKLLDLSNSCFYVDGNPLRIVQFGEMETLAFALLNKCEAIVIDERITRLLLESPESLAKLLSKRLHANVKMDKTSLMELDKITNGIKLIRSVELVAVAYSLGLLDKFIVHVPRARQELLDSILWGVKLNGCAVSEYEIAELSKLAQSV